MTHDEAVATRAVEGYVLCDMTFAERDEFEDHYADCEECFAAVIVVLRYVWGLRDGAR